MVDVIEWHPILYRYKPIQKLLFEQLRGGNNIFRDVFGLKPPRLNCTVKQIIMEFIVWASLGCVVHKGYTNWF